MRQNVNHLDRIIWVCRADHLAKHVAFLEALTATTFLGPYPSDALGAHICMSNSAGLQLMAPIDGATTTMAQALTARLDEHGEGVFAAVFGVPDIGAAQARLEALGYRPEPFPFSQGDEPWADEIGTVTGAIACRITHTTFICAEIEYPDHVWSIAGSSPGTRRNNDHVDHVAWLCRPENYDDIYRHLSELGGTRLDGPHDIPRIGLRIAISWETGLEVITPIPGNDGPAAIAANRTLDERGEGIYAVIFGVSDVDAALDRARAVGLSPGPLITGSDPTSPWRSKYTRFLEVDLGRVLNDGFMFSDIEYPDTVLVTQR